MLYLSLGSQRSLQKAWDTWTAENRPGKGKTLPPGTWTKWASDHDWFQRAQAWDVEIARQQRAGMASELEGIARQRVSALRLLMTKGLQLLSKVNVDLISPIEAADKIGVAANMISVAAAQLRAEAGEPDRLHITTGEPDLDDLTNEQLERIVAEARSSRRAIAASEESGG